nr:MAG TPA: hypothetical protein [Caudoviricetes sp.]
MSSRHAGSHHAPVTSTYTVSPSTLLSTWTTRTQCTACAWLTALASWDSTG